MTRESDGGAAHFLSWRERWNVPNDGARNAFRERCERQRSARRVQRLVQGLLGDGGPPTVVLCNGVVAAGSGACFANPGSDPTTIHQVGHLSLGVVLGCRSFNARSAAEAKFWL